MFASGDGRMHVECCFELDTIWLSQATMVKLHDKDARTINEHLANVFSEGKLVQNSTIRKFRIVRREGKRQASKEIDHYSLETILAIGYRVRSPRGTQFRQRATQTLQEYLIRGFVMDGERLKNPPVGSSVVPDYFDEMLERIRDIRASERRVCLRMQEISVLAADYQPSLRETTQFFQTIQNKLHFVCTGHIVAELIHKRADASQPHMDLTGYKDEGVRKDDVTVTKNYLTQGEVSELNRVVNMWLGFAGGRTHRHQQVFLRDWQDRLNQFPQFNDRKVLQGIGKISKRMADEEAQTEYVRFTKQQRRLKEAEGKRGIAGLLQWNKESKK